MVAVERLRRRGLGTCAMEAVLAHVVEHGGNFVWCHVRPSAIAFYQVLGFEVETATRQDRTRVPTSRDGHVDCSAS